jgi:hypothetical protein
VSDTINGHGWTWSDSNVSGPNNKCDISLSAYASVISSHHLFLSLSVYQYVLVNDYLCATPEVTPSSCWWEKLAYFSTVSFTGKCLQNWLVTFKREKMAPLLYIYSVAFCFVDIAMLKDSGMISKGHFVWKVQYYVVNWLRQFWTASTLEPV